MSGSNTESPLIRRGRGPQCHQKNHFNMSLTITDKIKNHTVGQIIQPLKSRQAKMVEEKDAKMSQDTPQSGSRENTIEASLDSEGRSLRELDSTLHYGS